MVLKRRNHKASGKTSKKTKEENVQHSTQNNPLMNVSLLIRGNIILNRLLMRMQ